MPSVSESRKKKVYPVGTMRDSDSAADGWPLVGDVIAGKYRIESIAGEGGMGIVYEAEHVILRQRVAVKALRPGSTTSADAIERFSVEASAIARIASEHVVRVMDAGSLPSGAPYLVMEYLDGCDLCELLLRRGPLPAAEVVDFALQALDALAHAHAAQVIHRDLKPANLFYARCSDGRRIIKLVDFGISKSIELGSEDDRVAGSPVYMSPEQLKRASLDPRTDLWSLGVVIYELIAGAPPFTGDDFSNLVSAILEKDATPLGEKVPGIAPELSAIVDRCLMRDPAARWSTTAELARALAKHGTGAWAGALERIDRALSNAAEARVPRRFETLENALQALETERKAGSGRPNVFTPEVYGATIPAPPSEPEVKITLLPESPRPALAEKPRLRILLIDDSEFVLDVHEHVLSKAGFDVRTTSSVGEFDALLESYKPHLVLMDVEMPGMSGDVLCKRVKAKFKASVPVVFVSSLPREALARRANAGNADAFFSKTSDWESFVDFVRNICAITYSPEDLP
jgi:eukaryotic-like serine/threonine-protein kinase